MGVKPTDFIKSCIHTLVRSWNAHVGVVDLLGDDSPAKTDSLEPLHVARPAAATPDHPGLCMDTRRRHPGYVTDTHRYSHNYNYIVMVDTSGGKPALRAKDFR